MRLIIAKQTNKHNRISKNISSIVPLATISLTKKKQLSKTKLAS